MVSDWIGCDFTVWFKRNIPDYSCVSEGDVGKRNAGWRSWNIIKGAYKNRWLGSRNPVTQSSKCQHLNRIRMVLLELGQSSCKSGVTFQNFRLWRWILPSIDNFITKYDAVLVQSIHFTPPHNHGGWRSCLCGHITRTKTRHRFPGSLYGHIGPIGSPDVINGLHGNFVPRVLVEVSKLVAIGCGVIDKTVFEGTPTTLGPVQNTVPLSGPVPFPLLQRDPPNPQFGGRHRSDGNVWRRVGGGCLKRLKLRGGFRGIRRANNIVSNQPQLVSGKRHQVGYGYGGGGGSRSVKNRFPAWRAWW